MHIGVTFPGPPRSPDTFSGVPARLIDAFERMDVEVTAIDTRLPLMPERVVRGLVGLRMMARSSERAPTVTALRDNVRVSSQLGATRSLALRRKHASLAKLEAIVQMGSDYLLPSFAPPYVTYEDMTVPQAVRAGYPVWSTLPQALLDSRVEMQKRMYIGARACCFESSWAAGSAIEDFGVDARKVHVVGIGPNHIVTVPSREWAVPRFLFVGKDWQRKNGESVVRAFEEVRAGHPGARLDLVGEVPPIEREGVRVHGMLRLSNPAGRAQLEQLLREATCFVLPSLHEPSALAYVDAAHAGLPSIVSTAGGSEELVGAGGLGVDPTDYAALLAAMLELSDPERARAMGEAAHAHAQLYTWDAVAQRLLRAALPEQAEQRDLAPFL